MTWERASWMAMGCGALLALSAEASAAKVGGGAVVAAGDLGSNAVAGVQASGYLGFPKVERLSVGADLTWFLIDGATAFSIDPNVHFTLIKLPILDVYPIAGVELLYLHANVLGRSATEIDPGFLLGAGAEAKAGPLRPYVEAKVLLQQYNYVALSGGLRVAF